MTDIPFQGSTQDSRQALRNRKPGLRMTDRSTDDPRAKKRKAASSLEAAFSMAAGTVVKATGSD
ncbi:hypothetical protein [Rhizobium sp. CAU 1783]